MVKTDDKGIGLLKIPDTPDSPGRWRLEFQHQQKLENDPEADLEVRTATLVFDIAAKPEAAP